MNIAKVDYVTQQMTSKLTNYSYTINIYVPNEEAPQNGFPVLYVLDGSSYFNLVKEAVRLQSRNAPKQVSFQLSLLELVMAMICVKEDFMILQRQQRHIYIQKDLKEKVMKSLEEQWILVALLKKS